MERESMEAGLSRRSSAQPQGSQGADAETIAPSGISAGDAAIGRRPPQGISATTLRRVVRRALIVTATGPVPCPVPVEAAKVPLSR
jgi:hypothetical protein